MEAIENAVVIRISNSRFAIRNGARWRLEKEWRCTAGPVALSKKSRLMLTMVTELVKCLRQKRGGGTPFMPQGKPALPNRRIAFYGSPRSAFGGACVETLLTEGGRLGLVCVLATGGEKFPGLKPESRTRAVYAGRSLPPAGPAPPAEAGGSHRKANVG